MQRCCSQPSRGKTRRSDEESEREREREAERGSATLPCGCALPHIADAAFESLGGVPEGADATVPVAVVGGLFGLSFWPEKISQNVEVKLVLGNATEHISRIKKKGDCGKHNTPCNARATRHGLNRGGVVINIGFESRQVQPLD